MTTPPTIPIDSPNPLTRGVQTSEFWVTVVTVLAYGVVTFLPPDIVTRWTVAHGWIGGLVAAVYVAARGYVKGKAVE